MYGTVYGIPVYPTQPVFTIIIAAAAVAAAAAAAVAVQ